VLLFCDLHLMNEYTSPHAFAGLHHCHGSVRVDADALRVKSDCVDFPLHAV